MIAAALVIPAVLTVMVVQEEPCGAFLQPMETVTIPNLDSDGEPTQTVQTVSVADTETRKIVADYMRPDKFAVGPYPMIGTVEMTNKSAVRRKLRYRQSCRIEEGFVPFFDQGSPLCWEPEKRRVVVYYEQTLGPSGSETIDISWSLTLRKENQLADINADGAVNGLDQGILMSDWGTDNPRSDLNKDGTVNGLDLGILFSQWSESSNDEAS